MTYQYDSDGMVVRRPKYNGRMIERNPLEVLPCATCPKIPNGMEPTPRNAVELSERNWQVYRHWHESVSVFKFTDVETQDAIVRANASIMREIDIERQQAPLQQLGGTMLALNTISRQAPEPDSRPKRGRRS